MVQFYPCLVNNDLRIAACSISSTVGHLRAMPEQSPGIWNSLPQTSIWNYERHLLFAIVQIRLISYSQTLFSILLREQTKRLSLVDVVTVKVKQTPPSNKRLISL